MQDFVSSQMIVRVQLSRIGCLGSGFSQQFASRRAQGSYSCGVWLGFKTLVELEVKHQVSWLHKLTHYVSFCFLGSILIEEPPRCMYHMEDLRCKDLCKNHVKLTLSSLWFLHVSPRCSQFKGLSAESPIAPFVSPTYFSSLDVHVKIYAKMFEGCVCFTVRGAFLVSEAGGELRNCGTDQNSPFFCSCVKFGQIRFFFCLGDLWRFWKFRLHSLSSMSQANVSICSVRVWQTLVLIEEFHSSSIVLSVIRQHLVKL